MDILNKIHREIVPLSPEDSFLVEDRTKEYFDYPMHFHPELELNFVLNGKNVRRMVGDSIEKIDDIDLVLVGTNLHHVWEQHECTNKEIREVTIQFHNDLFSDAFLDRSVMRPIKEMLEHSSHGILFSRETSMALNERILKVSKMEGMDNFMEIFSILYDLAISRNQRLLSTLSVKPMNFENSKKIKLLYDYVQKN
ncbi:MAG: AraC family transcriptional regulator, partial [Maribacter sp.]|nr:AraC family transcriptional regulator [Maribacter sp.]